MDQFIIFCAKYLIVAPMGALLAYVRREGLVVAKQVGLELLIALPLAYAVARLGGLFVYHEQPFAVQGFEPLLPHAIDNSFPSDHMLVASVVAAVVSLRHRSVGLSLWIIAGVIGLARVAAGLHYPIDIIAAALIAVGAVFVARYCISFFFQGR